MTREIAARELGETTAAEEALARAHEFLAETLRAKAELMAQLGHEIRTPLNGIVGMTELLLGTGLSGEQREYAAATMVSATTLMAVINDVLDFSMLEAGTLELDVGAFEIRHLVESVAQTAHGRSAKSAPAINWELSPDVPDAVTGDGSRVRHVLAKLVASTLADAGDGSLRIVVSATSHGSKRLMLRFEVVAEHELEGDLDSLFEVTSYSLGAMHEDRPAAIGLAVSKQLAELMGGDIGVHTASGSGTTFWFTTPVGLDGAQPYPDERVRFSPTPPPAPASARRRANSGARANGTSHCARLLIADDDPVSQLVLTRQLEARGYAVDVASNGREAIELHAKGGYSAIFMDCQMPELNGYEATITIREHEGNAAHTPIIAMTASARESDREQCATSGMDDYVAKPLDQVTLDAALARRLTAYDEGAGDAVTSNGKRGTRRRGVPAAAPPLPLLENSVLTDVFRHNSESRGYLIGVFIEESQARIAQLVAAETAGHPATMQRLAHALKGSAGAVGARRLEQICRAIYEAALEDRAGDASKLHAPLEQCFELTCELLRKGCPESTNADSERR